MITMEMLGKVRRMHLRDKLSLHEISKRTGLARNTLRKWVRMPEEAVAPPRYQRELKPTKLSAFHATLEQALKADALRNKQNRRTGKALFAQIKADGYPGSYSRVTDFIRDWCGNEGKAPHAFVPLTFELGEAFQFDWSEEGLVIGGIYRRMQVSHLKLCASRAFWLAPCVRLVDSQSDLLILANHYLFDNYSFILVETTGRFQCQNLACRKPNFLKMSVITFLPSFIKGPTAPVSSRGRAFCPNSTKVSPTKRFALRLM